MAVPSRRPNRQSGEEEQIPCLVPWFFGFFSSLVGCGFFFIPFCGGSSSCEASEAMGKNKTKKSEHYYSFDHGSVFMADAHVKTHINSL
jgi:hypothetical protein